ncbi:MAG: cation transporter [Mariprofundaceae bacterium]
MSDCGCEIEAGNREQRNVLLLLLLINAVMFGVELVLGIVAQSTGLIADSMDMLADAMVYAVSLYAVGRALHHKIRAAHLSGILQCLLGLMVMFDVVRRAVVGSEPDSMLMIYVGLLALAANAVCLLLISKHRKGEIHMRASWIFSRNDLIANVGVIAGGLLVGLFASPIPDLLIGSIISFIVVKGGISIIRDANIEQESSVSH